MEVAAIQAVACFAAMACRRRWTVCTDVAVSATRFLATMPDDENWQIAQAMSAAEPSGSILMRYTCPNGHPYYIANCGRPWTLGACADCGAQVGGSGHEFVDNVQRVGERVTSQLKVGAAAWTSHTRGSCHENEEIELFISWLHHDS